MELHFKNRIAFGDCRIIIYELFASIGGRGDRAFKVFHL